VDGAEPGGKPAGIENAIERGLEAASLGVDVVWPEFNDTLLDGPRQFAEVIHKHYPNQMLGFNLSPSLHWGKAKEAGTLLTNAQLGQLGYTLQFSTLLAFRSTGMVLEKTLKSFRGIGLEALANLQLAEISGADPEPITRKHQVFCGTNRWLTLEKITKEAGE
jgi:isocitrate/methylisocitrate lyase